MGINLTTNFNLNNNLPLDARNVVQSLSDIATASKYDGMVVYQKSDSKFYKLVNGTFIDFNKEVNDAIALKADTTFVNTIAQSLASGSPKGSYANLSALTTAFPTGNTNIYLTLDNGNWNYWNGSVWVGGGVYQATGLGAGSVTPSMIQANSLNVAQFKSDFTFNSQRFTPNTAYPTITTKINTGIYFVDINTTGIPSAINTQVCTLENTLCQNRFQYQKIYKYTDPTVYYIRYFDADAISGEPAWTKIDPKDNVNRITALETQVNDLSSSTVVKNIVSCNPIGTGTNERQREYTIPLGYTITSDMIGQVLTFNMRYTVDYADYIQSTYFKIGLSDTGTQATIGGVFTLTQASASRSSVVTTASAISTYYTHTFTVTSSHVGANYLFVYEDIYLQGDTSVSREVAFYNEWCEGKPITVRGYNYGCQFSRLVNPSNQDLINTTIADIKREVTLLHNKSKLTQDRNPFEWKPFNKAYVTLVFDDGRHDVDKVWNIFKEYNVSCSLAVSSDVLNTNATLDGTTGTVKLRDVIDEMLLDSKNELLGHGKYHTGITSYLTEEEVAVECRDAQMQYMSLGYNNVRGSMRAGANDKYGHYASNNYDDAGWGYMYRRYFDYGDSIAYDNAYNQTRTYFNNTLDYNKALVDSAITNKTWLRFFAHTLDGTETNITEANLRAFIEYVISKGTTQIEFRTYRYMYDSFKTTNLEKRIAVLETP